MVYANREQEKRIVEMIIEKNTNRMTAKHLKKLLIGEYKTAPSDRIMNKIMRKIPGTNLDETCKKIKTYNIDIDTIKKYYSNEFDSED